MSYQFEEQQKKLDREIMYLLNKIKTHPPPKPKATVNSTNTTSNTTDSKVVSSSSSPDLVVVRIGYVLCKHYFWFAFIHRRRMEVRGQEVEKVEKMRGKRRK